MTTDSIEPLLTVEQVAAMINLPTSWVYSASAAGKIPGRRKFGKYVRFDPVAIRAWMQQEPPPQK